MPPRFETLDGVTESGLRDVILDFRDSRANIVSAFRDPDGDGTTFIVEATFFDAGAPQGSATLRGKMSHFGGPNDTGVGSSEGLALFFDASHVAANPDLFLPAQPPGTTGLARRLNPDALYIACRWEYSVTPKDFLRQVTTKVKVTNPANGRSRLARPVDWGPHVSTGRVADLSPGLEDELGLETDDVCELLIPFPGDGPAVIDMAAIDAEIFPPEMTRALVSMTTRNNATYWVVNQLGQVEAGQTLMLRVGQGEPKILRSDTTILPLEPDDDVPTDVARELNKVIHPEPPLEEGPGGSPGGDANAKLFTLTNTFVGTSTSNVPGTDNGNLACAWAVNEVVRRALGKPISTIGGGKNGLATAQMFEILKARHTRLPRADDATPGTIIISPTVGAKHGHVGIIGTDPPGNGLDNMHIFSNSSGNARFERNHTLGRWKARYATQLGLQVAFFNLKADQL